MKGSPRNHCKSKSKDRKTTAYNDDSSISNDVGPIGT